MNLLYWLDRCPWTGKDRSAVESIIPNIKQVKLIRDPGNYIYIFDGPNFFEISGPGIQAVAENLKIRGLMK